MKTLQASFFIMVVFVLVPVILFGCTSVSQQAYDELNGQLATSQQKNKDIEGQLSSDRQQLDAAKDLQNEISDQKAQLAKSKQDLETAVTQNKNLEAKLEQTMALLTECQAGQAGQAAAISVSDNESVNYQADIDELKMQIESANVAIYRAVQYADFLKYMSGFLKSEDDLIAFAGEIQARAKELNNYGLYTKVLDLMSAMEKSAKMLGPEIIQEAHVPPADLAYSYDLKIALLQQYISEYDDLVDLLSGCIMDPFDILLGPVKAITDVDCMSMPTLPSDLIKTMPAGSIGIVVDGPMYSDDHAWYKVSWTDGTTGWSMRDDLESAL